MRHLRSIFTYLIIFFMLGLAQTSFAKPVFRITAPQSSVNLSSSGSATINFNIRNVSGVPLTISNISSKGYDSHFLNSAIITNNCLSRLAKNASCNVSSRINAKGQDGETEFEINACAFNGSLCSGMKRLIKVTIGAGSGGGSGNSNVNLSLSSSNLSLIAGGHTATLTVSNPASVALAGTTVNNITASGMPSGVTLDDSDCATVAPGQSCQLRFTSSNRPIPPTTLTISGTNTNTITAELSANYVYAADSSVEVMQLDSTNHILYIGGAFTELYQPVGGGVLFAGNAETPTETMARVAGTVRISIPDGLGGWYIGGLFGGVDGIERNNIAHILNTGRVDEQFNPNANGEVRALALDSSNNRLYVGGLFNGASSIGGANRDRIASLNATTGLADSWNPGCSGIVQTLLFNETDQRLYVGGSFFGIGSIGGQARDFIARFNADRTIDTVWDPDANSDVQSLISNGPTLFVGGGFLSFNGGGLSRQRLASIDISNLAPNTAAVFTAWDPRLNGTVNAMALNGNTLYAGGSFTNVNTGGLNPARSRLAAFDINDNTADNETGWDPSATGTVFALAIKNNIIYVGGFFNGAGSVGGQERNYLAAIDAAGVVQSWNPNPESFVQSIVASNDTFFVGGTFNRMGTGIARNYLAAIDTTTGQPTDWNPNLNGSVRAMALKGTTLYVGGNFTQVNQDGANPVRNRLASFDTTDNGPNNVTDFDPNIQNGIIRGLYIDGNTLYAGGSFNGAGSAAGQLRNRGAAFDITNPNATVITGWDPNADNQIFNITSDGNFIYIGGNFTTINGGAPLTRLARTNPSDGTIDVGWTPNPTSSISSLAINGNTLYVGGFFNGAGSIAGQNRDYIAAFDTTTGNITGWGPLGGNQNIYAFAFNGTTVYAGGQFTTIGGENRSRFAAIHANTSLIESYDPSPSASPLSLLYEDDILFMGGGFNYVNFMPTKGLAILSPPNS